MAEPTEPSGSVVAVLADDLIWASRLVAAVERTGARAARLTTAEQLQAVLAAESESEPAGGRPRLVGVIVDLGGRRYEGSAAVAHAVAARQPVIAVAQHDDGPTRRRALEAGAQRVFSYAKLFTDGQGVIERWLAAERPLESRA